MKRSKFSILSALVLCGSALLLSSQAAEQRQLLTQGDLAKRVVFISGLADSLPAPVSGEIAANALTEKGWTPIEGWRVGAIATKEDFFVVMARYLGLKARNPNDPKSYKDALVAAGFTFGGLGAKATPTELEQRDRSITRLVISHTGVPEYRESAAAPWQKLYNLLQVKEGMSFRTGAASSVDLVYAKGAAQRLNDNSEITVEMLRDEVVNGAPVSAVVVYIAKGEAISIVDPMNKSSQFVMKDPFGKFEVDKAAGCQFTARVSDEQSITLNDSEGKIFGHKALALVQPRSSYGVLRGGGTCTFGGNVQNLSAGQRIVATGNPGSSPQVTLGVGNDRGSEINAAALVESLNRRSEELTQTPSSAADKGLMTSSELTSLLGGFGPGPGSATSGGSLDAVTPIQ